MLISLSVKIRLSNCLKVRQKMLGFEFDIDDENNFIIKKATIEAMTSDNTKFADLSNLRKL